MIGPWLLGALGGVLVADIIVLRQFIRARRKLRRAIRARDAAIEMRKWVETVGDWPPS